jgi:sulfonate transport system permease protein
MLVGLLIYATLGLVVDIIVRLLERRLLAWRPSLLGTS